MALATSNYPGPKAPASPRYAAAGPALVQPLEGALCDRADFNLLLEYWSVGVLENRIHDKHLLVIKPEIDGILFPWRPRALDHYSITPTLPGLFKAEPAVSDLAQRTRISMFD